MYELIQVSEHDYYIQSPAKIGLVRLDDKRVCIIDSGNDKDAGKKIRRILEANGWELAAIYNTHSHADHIGGSRYLQEQTGCAVYAPGMEAAFTEHTILEPALLWGGCPPKDLRHKFLMAQGCRCAPLTAEALPDGFELIPLPGHSPDMTALRTPDGTVYLGDSLSGRETLDKYQIGYVYDIEAYLASLEKVKELEGRRFIPSHAEAAESVAELAQYNIDKVLETASRILELCAAPISFEALLQRIFTDYGLTMTFEQHALIGSTLRSHLARLRGRGELEPVFENNMLLWKRA